MSIQRQPQAKAPFQPAQQGNNTVAGRPDQASKTNFLPHQGYGKHSDRQIPNAGIEMNIQGRQHAGQRSLTNITNHMTNLNAEFNDDMLRKNGRSSSKSATAR
jgi:hypothetical protein